MAEEKAKCAVIIPSSQVVGEGDQRRVVPNIVKVFTEKDLNDKLILKGPEKMKDGTNKYITIDGKKLSFDGKTGAILLSLWLFAVSFFNFAPQSFAQAPGRTKVQIPAIEAPYVTQDAIGGLARATLLTVNVSAGKVYLGSGPITVAEELVTGLTDSKTDCDGPTYSDCNIIYADSSGAIAKTTSIATARGSGNSILAYIETDATKVTTIQAPWQDTRSDIDVAATADALTSNPTDCGANTYATAIAANGNLTCASITNASTTAVATNTPSTIVLRDGSGDFAAGTITAALTGNASTATALAANPADCGANTYATTIAASGALTCASITNASTTGVSTATASTLVLRDASADFAAHEITSDLIGDVTGNADTATALAANPTDCGANTYATTIAANGNLTCAGIDLAADVGASITPVANGGTGLASGTSGGVPAYTAAGTITSSAALAANQLVLGGGAGAVPATLGGLGTTTTVLHGNAGGAPSFAAVSLTADVSGVAPIANGGTGVANGVTQVTTNGTQVNAGTCQAQTPLAVVGTLTTSGVAWALTGIPDATWQTGITVLPVTTADVVTLYLCNPTAGNITPAAVAVNVKVIK